MNGINLTDLVAKTIEFQYEGASRKVDVEQTKECGNGSTIVIGRDHDRNMQYRSFKVQKMVEVKVG